MTAAENRRRLAMLRAEPTKNGEGQLAPGLSGAEWMALNKIGGVRVSSAHRGSTTHSKGWHSTRAFAYGKNLK